MGIKVTGKTKSPEALKLISKISTYLFEQEYEELKGKESVKTALKNAISELKTLLSKDS